MFRRAGHLPIPPITSTTPLASIDESISTGTQPIEVTQLHHLGSQAQNAITAFFPGRPQQVAETSTAITKKIDETSRAYSACLQSEGQSKAKRAAEAGKLKEKLDDLVRRQYLLTIEGFIPSNQAAWARDINSWLTEGVWVACTASSLEANHPQAGTMVGFATLAIFTENKDHPFGSASIYVLPDHQHPEPIITSLVDALESMAREQRLPRLLSTTADDVQSAALTNKGYLALGPLGSLSANGAEHTLWEKMLTDK